MTLANVVNFSPIANRRIGNIVATDTNGLSLNLMSLLSASARTVAAGHLINLGTTLTVPITNSSVSTRMTVGNQMTQVSAAKIGDTIQTAQVRVALVTTVTSINLVVATVTVQVPVYLEMASGQATLAAMPCTSGGNLVQVAASSGLTKVSFGTVSDAAMNNFSAPVVPVAAPIVAISLLTIPIQVNIAGSSTVAASGPTTLSFSQAEINAGTVKSVPGTAAAPFTLLSTNFTLSTVILGSPGALAGGL